MVSIKGLYPFRTRLDLGLAVFKIGLYYSPPSYFLGVFMIASQLFILFYFLRVFMRASPLGYSPSSHYSFPFYFRSIHEFVPQCWFYSMRMLVPSLFLIGLDFYISSKNSMLFLWKL